MNNPFGNQDNSKEFKPLRWLFGIVLVSLFVFVIYQNYIVYFTENRYTIGVISGTYSSSKSIGRLYSFNINDDVITHSCTTKSCRNLTLGDRYIVRYYVGHKIISELMVDYSVPVGIEAPKDGWNKIPDSIVRREGSY